MVHGILFDNIILTRNNINAIASFTDFIMKNMAIGNISDLNAVASISRAQC